MPRIDTIEYGFEVEVKGLTRPLTQQVHGNRIIEVNRDNLASLYLSPPEADGVYTRTPGLRLSVFTADCLPLLFYTSNPAGPIAALHCGWRGAQQNIVGALMEHLREWKRELHVVLGPSIMTCCFEVRSDLIASFEAAGYDLTPYLTTLSGKTHFSLSSFIIDKQLDGFSQNQVHTEGLICTFCSSPVLPSFRRDKQTDPRIRAWIRRID